MDELGGAAASALRSARQQLTAAQVPGMRVGERRAELQRRGLSTVGRKAQLVSRLLGAL